jgi:threonine synthase
MFTCPHTGVALAALEALAARGVVKRDDRVVVMSTAHGLKFSDFKVGYHEGRLPGVRSLQRNPPVRIAASLAGVQDAIAARLGRG